jgi:pilus assembly protein Flp/PilA
MPAPISFLRRFSAIWEAYLKRFFDRDFLPLNVWQHLARRIRPLARAGGSRVSWKLGTRSWDMQFIRKMLKDSKGATAIEYGLIAALIAVAAITAMGSLGNNLKNTFNNVSGNMK